MTPITTKLQNGIELLFQEVGNDAQNFEIKSTSIGKPDQLAHDVHWAYGIYITNQRLIVLPQGDWQLLGLSTELSEKQLSEVMPTTLMHQKHKVTTYKYKSYEAGFMGFPTSIESFNSLKVGLSLDEGKKYVVLIKRN